MIRVRPTRSVEWQPGRLRPRKAKGDRLRGLPPKPTRPPSTDMAAGFVIRHGEGSTPSGGMSASSSPARAILVSGSLPARTLCGGTYRSGRTDRKSRCAGIAWQRYDGRGFRCQGRRVRVLGLWRTRRVIGPRRVRHPDCDIPAAQPSAASCAQCFFGSFMTPMVAHSAAGVHRFSPTPVRTPQ